jgi:arylsulfatase A-like enzyme
MKTTKNFTRRKFIRTTSAAVLGANIIGCSKKSQKPNLLFIWTDEQRADTMQVYGNHKIQAPNLNKLAGQSVTFRNPYVSQPVCTPSRSTVMTGLWPHQNSCVRNNIPLPEDVKCFPEIIDDPDYATGYFGKWHLGDEIFAQHGFREWKSIEDGYRKYYRAGRSRDQKSDYWHFLKELGYQPDTKDSDFSRGFAARRPLAHCKPKFLELESIDFLKRHQSEPFMLFVNFLEPHMPFFGPLDHVHDPLQVELPVNFNDPLEDNEPLRYRYLQQSYLEKGSGDQPLRTEADWRRLIANYWGLVTQVDLSVGAILDALENLGLADNTIVVYTSDHGDMMGSHRLLAKTVMYEEAVKVPWLMRLPQHSLQKKVIEQRVSHIDLVPTLLELMAVRSNMNLPGQSLVPLIKGNKLREDHVYIEWNAPEKQNLDTLPQNNYTRKEMEAAAYANIRTVIAPDGWKLSLSDGDKTQLFNLNDDPLETKNLYDSGQFQEVIERLTTKIHNWQKSAEDEIGI